MSSIRISQRYIGYLALASLCLGLVTCGGTRQRRDMETSGFLGDYSQLTKSTEEDPALLSYVNRKVRWGQYDAIIIQVVQLWGSPDLEKLSPDDAQMLTDYAFHTLHEHLGRDFRILDEPGPGVIRLRAAITEARGAAVARRAASTVMPQAAIVSGIVGNTADTAITVGTISIEVELLDSLSGEPLHSAADRRSGRKRISGMTLRWVDVQEALDFWAERLRERLVQLRAEHP